MKEFKSGPEKNTSGFETKNYSEQFKGFLNQIKTLDASAEEVNGKKMEYVKAPLFYPIYKKNFGNDALVVTAIHYRLKQLEIGEEFPDDLQVMADAGAGDFEARYYINRLKKPLLEKIYMPTSPKPTGDYMMKKVNKLDEAFRNEESFEDDEDDLV